MRNFFVCLVALALIGAGVWLTIVFIQSDTFIAIPFVWVMMLGGAAEAINVGIVQHNKKDKNGKKEGK